MKSIKYNNISLINKKSTGEGTVLIELDANTTNIFVPASSKLLGERLFFSATFPISVAKRVVETLKQGEK